MMAILKSSSSFANLRATYTATNRKSKSIYIGSSDAQIEEETDDDASSHNRSVAVYSEY